MKAVIFDLFETLVTEWGRPKYTTREVAYDLDVDCEAFRREWKLLYSDRHTGKLSESVQAYRAILGSLGVTRAETLLGEIVRKRDACKRKCFEAIAPEIIEMLSSLRDGGCKIALISNCSTEEIAGLRDCALYPYFDAAVLSCEVGLVKPDAGIYAHCMSLLKEEPSNCFYVGDGGSDELSGAQKAGMTPLKALWFIKHFVKEYDENQEYPAFLVPSECTAFIRSCIGPY